MSDVMIENVNMTSEDFSKMINYVGSRAIRLSEIEEGIAVNTSNASSEKEIHNSIVFFFNKWNNAYGFNYDRFKDIEIIWR